MSRLDPTSNAVRLPEVRMVRSGQHFSECFSVTFEKPTLVVITLQHRLIHECQFTDHVNELVNKIDVLDSAVYSLCDAAAEQSTLTAPKTGAAVLCRQMKRSGGFFITGDA